MLINFENSFTAVNINELSTKRIGAYNTSRHLFETSLHYYVKQKSLKSCIWSTNSWWQSGRAVALLLNFYVSHGSTARFARGGEKYYIYIVDNSLLFLVFPTVNTFPNRLTVDEVIAKIRHHVYLDTVWIN